MSNDNKRTAPGSHRVTMTLTADEYAKLQFWADRRDMSINEYLHESLSHMIDYENGVYDAPTIMQERMNLVIESLTMSSSKLDSLAKFITDGFEALLAAARGDDYLHNTSDDSSDGNVFDDFDDVDYDDNDDHEDYDDLVESEQDTSGDNNGDSDGDTDEQLPFS